MRLLNTVTLQFKEFYTDIPPYVILSHRWGEDEISYAEFLTDQKKGSEGHVKIIEACGVAFEYYDYEWIWIDTCCINKDSSAELSEAINSMYRWYGESRLCLAYLRDVSVDPNTNSEHVEDFERQMRNSKWFTRGWTLQELLAPSNLMFLNNRWEPIGVRTKFDTLISEITGIDRLAMSKVQPLDKWSIAARMSWASRRKTSRVEDEAYCLLGLFGINMPLLYGEGRNAFRRLQQEIIRTQDDESVFVWGLNPSPSFSLPTWSNSSLFAQSPADFERCGNVVRSHYFHRQPYLLTNRGLQIEADYFYSKNESLCLFQINCSRMCDGDSSEPLALILTASFENDWKFHRIRCVATHSDEDAHELLSAGHRNKTVIYIANEELPGKFDIIGNNERLSRTMAQYDRKEVEFDNFLQEIEHGLKKWTDFETEMLPGLSYSAPGLGTAIEICIKALRAYERSFGPKNKETLHLVFKIGNLSALDGKTELAMKMYKRTLQGLDKVEGPDFPSRRMITRRMKSLSDVNSGQLRTKKLLDECTSQESLGEFLREFFGTCD